MRPDARGIWETFARVPLLWWKKLGVHFYTAGDHASIEFRNGQKIDFKGPPGTFSKITKYDVDLLHGQAMADMAEDLIDRHYETGVPIAELEVGRLTSVKEKIQIIRDTVMANLEDSAYLAPLPAGVAITATVKEPTPKGKWLPITGLPLEALVTIAIAAVGVTEEDRAARGVAIEPCPVPNGSALVIKCNGHTLRVWSGDAKTFRQRKDGQWSAIKGSIRAQGHFFHV